MVWVSFALCQCMCTCILLGVRISSCVALVLGSTRRTEICGESLPSSGTIDCHIKSSYRALIAWEAPPVADVPSLLLFCAEPRAATNIRRLATPQALILRCVLIFMGFPHDLKTTNSVQGSRPAGDMVEDGSPQECGGGTPDRNC